MNARPPSTFLQRTLAARKIMVVDLGFLGDSAHLTPALWEIRRHYPQAELHTLSAAVGAETLGLAPCVTRAWAFPLTPESPPWWRHWDIIAALRREKFDVAYNFSGADRTIFLTALTGAPHRLAHEAGRRHFWNRWLIPEWISRRDRGAPVYEQRRQVLAAAGFTLEPPRFGLTVPEEAQTWARETIADRAIHLSINASGPEKEWPLGHWAALARELLEREPKRHLVATGSARPRERDRLEALQNSVNHPRLACFEAPSIARLAAALQRCSLHIGGDSGVLHLAFALAVPTLTVARQYEGLAEWLPRGAQHRALTAPRLEDITSAAMAAEAFRLLGL